MTDYEGDSARRKRQCRDVHVRCGGGRRELIGGLSGTITVVEAIPIWHKTALVPIAKGGKVIKYGEMIGEALVDIPKGGWVSHENIFSVPRAYADEYVNRKE